MWRRIKEERKTEKANKKDKSGWENNQLSDWEKYGDDALQIRNVR